MPLSLPVHLPDLLAQRLGRPLPGFVAQRRLAPELAYGRHHGPPCHNARQAAVLALLSRRDDEWTLPLIVRAGGLVHHAGQVSLPGGAVDPGEAPAAAACRELEEELGVPRDAVRLLGALSPLYVFASNYRVTPYVAVADDRLTLTPNPGEVAAVFELPLAALFDQRSYGAHTIERGPICFRAPHLSFAGQRVWGATALILAELAAVIEAAILSEPPTPGC